MDGARLSVLGNSPDDLRSGCQPRVSLPNRLAPRRAVVPAVQIAAKTGDQEHLLAASGTASRSTGFSGRSRPGTERPSANPSGPGTISGGQQAVGPDQ